MEEMLSFPFFLCDLLLSIVLQQGTSQSFPLDLSVFTRLGYGTCFMQ